LFCAKCGKELPAGATFCPNCGAPVGEAASAQPQGPLSGIDTLTKDQKAQEYWIWRLVAYIVDAIIVFIVLGVITTIVAIPAFFAGGGALFGAFFGGVAFLWGIIFVLYFTVMESSGGASIGKRAFNLKVVSKTGANPTFGEAFVRNISKIYWLLILLDVVVGLAVSRGYQEKYSDHLMGTRVIRT
jgi:uncharacterized RDD family membrane protein YckC